jgi:hypothetical protein
MLVGMNIIRIIEDKFDRSEVTGALHSSIRTGIQMVQLANRHLLKSGGVYGQVRTTQPLTVKPGQTRVVSCPSQIVVPSLMDVALMQQLPRSL